MVKFLLFSCFNVINISKKAKFQWKKRKFLNISQFFEASLLEITFEGFIWVVFIVFPRLSSLCFVFSCHYPYLSKIVENSKKKWKCLNISQFFKAFVLGVLNSKDLLGYLLIVFPRLIFLCLVLICHYPYLNKIVENSVKNQEFFRLC